MTDVPFFKVNFKQSSLYRAKKARQTAFFFQRLSNLKLEKKLDADKNFENKLDAELRKVEKDIRLKIKEEKHFALKRLQEQKKSETKKKRTDKKNSNKKKKRFQKWLAKPGNLHPTVSV